MEKNNKQKNNFINLEDGKIDFTEFARVMAKNFYKNLTKSELKERLL
jgi:hypothetical protein